MSRKNWCCRPRPARRLPRSRRWSPRARQACIRTDGLGPLLGGERRRRPDRRRAGREPLGPAAHQGGRRARSFLGVTAVSGRGETFKSGGRVVKNVTGYDLCKLLAGSWGTLAAMTDVTIKTLPRAETEATVLVLGLDDSAARKAMAAATGSFADVSAAAHLPATVAVRVPE